MPLLCSAWPTKADPIPRVPEAGTKTGTFRNHQPPFGWQCVHQPPARWPPRLQTLDSNMSRSGSFVLDSPVVDATPDVNSLFVPF